MITGHLTRRLRGGITFIVMLAMLLGQVAVAAYASCRVSSAHDHHRVQGADHKPGLALVDHAELAAADHERPGDPSGPGADGHCCDMHCQVVGAMLPKTSADFSGVGRTTFFWRDDLTLRRLAVSLDRPPKGLDA